MPAYGYYTTESNLLSLRALYSHAEGFFMSRVLLVESDYLSNMALRHHLMEAGFDVDSAYCGVSALAAISREAPRFLVTEVDLGPGPNGYEVACSARRMRSGVQVVYVTGRVRGPDDPYSASASDWIAKPYRCEEVEAVLCGSPLRAAA